ncbi:hypothetical protein [Kaistella sp.]|uniref:hypothetical protein n=1 Tax=Kaistella sp. TaxID=2782235 RepID=UPI003C513631
MRILPLLIASAAILFSCDKKEEMLAENASITTSSSDSVKSENTNSAIKIANNVELRPTVTPEEIAAAAAAVTNSSARPALNPEHGQPYHRCEIPVGAPIDSAPAQNAATQVMPQQNVSSNNFNTNPISPAASTADVGPKPALNPAHGEPHHRCDLQVGAPLI